jgi:phage I-like protein
MNTAIARCEALVPEMIVLSPLNQSANDSPLALVQLLPYGWVRTDKGVFLVDEQAMRETAADMASRSNQVVIDYEHQTLAGTEAPAAGWIEQIVPRGGEGLWAQVRWTERAREYISRGEYRYLSPVVHIRTSDRRVIKLHSAGLTNTPAIDGMASLDSQVESVAAKHSLVDPVQREVNRLLGISDDTFLTHSSLTRIAAKQEQSIDPVQREVNQLLGITDEVYLQYSGGR